MKKSILNKNSIKSRHQDLSFILFIVLFFSGPVKQNFAQPLAFPTAEGFGKYTVGGRGGKVYEVTNLNDSGAGSLRAAVIASGPRTVVFMISGTIELKSKLSISNPFITIAGQTAPGDGICVKNNPIDISASQVIIRYIRTRLGDVNKIDSDGLSSRFTKNMIIDHVSASWSTDEALSIYHCDGVTIQWCLISESLYYVLPEKGHHGFGAIWGGPNASFHHNLIAHHSSRNPRFASGCGNTDFRNNVIYNWGYNSAYGGEKVQQGDARYVFSAVNMVANYYKPGPGTKSGGNGYRIVQPSSRNYLADYGEWHIADNIMVGNPQVTADNWNGGVQPDDNTKTVMDSIKSNAPAPFVPIEQQTAETAYLLVLADVGATLPKRDALDARIVEETRNGTATYGTGMYNKDQGFGTKPTGMIDSQADVGGWPELKSTTAPVDTDHDGMPDSWEKDNGLNPNDPEDRNGIGKGGYTNLENYLNSTIEYPTSVSAPIKGTAPTEFDLVHNYPNPFNPYTKIVFNVPYQAKVQVYVYDLAGRNVAELINEEKSAGRHEVDFMAGNLNSGVYVCRISCANRIGCRKMLLIK